MRGILPQKRNHLEIVNPSEVEATCFCPWINLSPQSPFVPASRQRYTAEPKSVLPDLLCILSKQQLDVVGAVGHSSATARGREHPCSSFRFLN